MAALRHHPQHLRLSVLTQTDRTGRAIPASSSSRHSLLTELKFGIGIDNTLVQPYHSHRPQPTAVTFEIVPPI
ncbi:RING-H2 finger protein ATL67 [Senna tora]|uniref:RING-H2 finger protein ATL67 n=1 Tax=Senna tora TaxID=362788 RepID=A0A834W1X7_9FABA|nr:RING-H2 finger protein ATL67 [Senna tora]